MAQSVALKVHFALLPFSYVQTLGISHEHEPCMCKGGSEHGAGMVQAWRRHGQRVGINEGKVADLGCRQCCGYFVCF